MPMFDDGAERWTLARRPNRPDDKLLPWASADTYLLREVRDQGLLTQDTRLLIANDAFGALGVALQHAAPQWWSDSHRAWRALSDNLDANRRPGGRVTQVPGDQRPEGPIDLVVMRFPKSLAWLEEQLLRLRPVLSPDALVVVGGMIKSTPRRAFELLETCIGPTKTSLGWKKARLAYARLDPSLSCAAGVASKQAEVPGFELPLESRPNVFSWERLDIGTRVLLGNLGTASEPLEIVDLGCGNGVLALALGHAYPNATVLGVDESYQAVASARDNARNHGLDSLRVRFEVADQLDDALFGDADLIVCNPPFHQAQVVGDQLAWDLFNQAKRALRHGGRFLVVGNRHLHYHDKLKRLFGNCTLVDSNAKFVVLSATR